MKPRLPPTIESLLPPAVLAHIYAHVPHLRSPSAASRPAFHLSPSAERDLRVMQHAALRGKSDMWLRGLEDFVLR
jgi:hypothetical protein